MGCHNLLRLVIFCLAANIDDFFQDLIQYSKLLLLTSHLWKGLGSPFGYANWVSLTNLEIGDDQRCGATFRKHAEVPLVSPFLY